MRIRCLLMHMSMACWWSKPLAKALALLPPQMRNYKTMVVTKKENNHSILCVYFCMDMLLCWRITLLSRVCRLFNSIILRLTNPPNHTTIARGSTLPSLTMAANMGKRLGGHTCETLKEKRLIGQTVPFPTASGHGSQDEPPKPPQLT